MRGVVAVAVCGLWLGAGAAQARVTEVQVLSQEPFADGAAFGPAGADVRIRATARGELDPNAPANAGITGLAQAPRNARGLVEYSTDVFILHPVRPAPGGGVLLYDVTNRGNKFLMSWINDAPEAGGLSVNDPRTAADAGNAFTFRRGYTMVWSGWQPEASTANAGMTIRVPDLPGAPPRRIRMEIAAGTRGPERVETVRLPYPAASTDAARARLTVRAREADPRADVPATGWEFVDANTVRLLPPGTAFTPRHLYDLWYEAAAPRVTGVGFAATRDLVSFLRHARADDRGNPNPLAAADGAPGVRHTLGLGISLSGRFLRHFLDLGMNADEAGRRVFDGVLAHISGAGKVFANEAFAMPFRTATQHEDRFYPEVWFPHATAPATDPASGRRGGLLRGDGTDPLVIETNTTTEYWQKAASLIHSDPASGADLALPDTARAYLIAGTQHGGRAAATATPGACANPRNPHSPAPALRALIAALEAWVRDGTAPPGNRVPRRADETGVPAAAVRYPAVPGAVWPTRDNAVGRPVDWVDPPPAPVDPMPTHVSAVDADGNERAGIRLPGVAVPLGTHTGTNLYRDLPSELCDRDGTFLPFARTRAEREASGDPRPSLQERYSDRAGYAARVRRAAEESVAARLLLPEDAERLAAAAASGDPF